MYAATAQHELRAGWPHSGLGQHGPQIGLTERTRSSSRARRDDAKAVVQACSGT